jgi:hypothetical protein
MQSVSRGRNTAGSVAFIGHQNKEMTMDDSTGAPGANTTPADSARRIKDAAATVIERGREAAMAKVQEKVHEGAERARSSAQSTTSALRRAADDVEVDNALIGTGLRKAADLLEQATGHINGGDLSRTLDGLNTFARRQPALFLGASLALGFVLARLGKTAFEDVVDTPQRPDGALNPDVASGL